MHTHNSEHTPGAVGSHCCSVRGEAGGSVPCSRVSPQSWYQRWRECLLFTPPTNYSCRTQDSNPHPQVTSPTLYPSGHDCPDCHTPTVCVCVCGLSLKNVKNTSINPSQETILSRLRSATQIIIFFKSFDVFNRVLGACQLVRIEEDQFDQLNQLNICVAEPPT